MTKTLLLKAGRSRQSNLKVVESLRENNQRLGQIRRVNKATAPTPRLGKNPSAKERKGLKSPRMDSWTEGEDSSSPSNRQPNSRSQINKSIESSHREQRTRAIARTLFAAQGSLLFPHSKLRSIADLFESTPSNSTIRFTSKASPTRRKTSRLTPLLPNHSRNSVSLRSRRVRSPSPTRQKNSSED